MEGERWGEGQGGWVEGGEANKRICNIVVLSFLECLTWEERATSQTEGCMCVSGCHRGVEEGDTLGVIKHRLQEPKPLLLRREM